MATPLPTLRTWMDGWRARLLETPLVRQVQRRWLDPSADASHSRLNGDGGHWLDATRAVDQVQRLGERAFGRMLARWPSLAELVASPVEARRKRRPAVVEPAHGAEPRVLDETALEALVVQLVAAPNWQSRAGAAAALAQLDGDGVREALTHALRDPSVEVAIAAVDALARRGDRAAQEALRAVLDNVDGYFSPVTRVAALSALGRMLGDGELAAIVSCLRDLDAEVSIAAIAVVADRKRSTAAEHLLPVLQDTSGYFLPIVRLAATNALIRADALTPELAQQLLDREQASAVRRVLERFAQCPP
ncbi:MAG TPA: HEAT repeat domain-containing protein [Polyangiales bacterium]|nr:HEAT repeat domain-containing protein [Polyangiales bacterium]